MKFALIGCSRISVNHLKAAHDNNFEIVALCDINRKNYDDLLEKCALKEEPEINFYADYREMIEQEPGIELVSIATPSNLHAEMALFCIEHKKHLIIEKPIALSIDEADEIVRSAAFFGVKVNVCHQNRLSATSQALKKAVVNGRFGKLSHGSIHVRWNRNAEYYEQAKWRGTWAQDGGCLMNQCIHGIDLLVWIMGSPVATVYAQTRQRFHSYIEAEDIGMAVLSFANGAIATIEGTTNVFPKNLEESLCLFGETGTVKLGGASASKIEVWDFLDNSAGQDLGLLMEQAKSMKGRGHYLLYKDIRQTIEQNGEPAIGAKAGRDALEIVLAIYKSQKTGLPVSLPLENFSTLDMKGEFCG